MKNRLGAVVIVLGIAGIIVFAAASDPQAFGYAKILFTKGPSAAIAQYRLDKAPKPERTTLTIHEINDQAAGELLSLINALRQKNGLSKLALDDTLCEVAQYRAALMKQHNVVGHDIPGEGTPDKTLRKLGVSYTILAENVALEPDRGSLIRTINSAHAGLCDSPGHLANMLNPDIRKLGVGVVVHNSVKWYLCEVFIAP